MLDNAASAKDDKQLDSLSIKQKEAAMKWGFYSCMRALPWGGSEELWSQAALRLLARGDEVSVNYAHRPAVPPRHQRIQECGGKIYWRRRWMERAEKHWARYIRFLPNRWLDFHAPQFVLITVGMHTDDMSIARACQRRSIPYAINVQCASESAVIDPTRVDEYRRAYERAKAVFFLSEANVEIVEQNLRQRVDRTRIVDNPFAVDWLSQTAWPDEEKRWRLACVGRLSFVSKGQDLVLRVLNNDKWRQRSLEVVFWGQDHGSQQQMEALIAEYGLQQQTRIAGFTPDIEQLWSQHHGLLLPSRYEGLPMVTVEAMLSGRISIVAACGRNHQLVDDGETGFIIPMPPTIQSVDSGLERAWDCRSRWQRMGHLAAQRIRSRYSADPAGDFAELLHEAAGRTTRQSDSSRAA